MELSIEIEKVMKSLYQHCEGSMFDRCGECPYYEVANESFQCRDALLTDVYALLKEHEVRELTMDEWQEWKTNKERDPICELWEYDTSPMWVLNPNDVHEPAFLMGKLKLFTGKPTFEQCKAVKWKCVN